MTLKALNDNFLFGVSPVKGSKEAFRFKKDSFLNATPAPVLAIAKFVQGRLSFFNETLTGKLSDTCTLWRHAVPFIELANPTAGALFSAVVKSSDAGEGNNDWNDVFKGAPLREWVKGRYYALAGRLALMVGNGITFAFFIKDMSATTAFTLQNLHHICTAEKVVAFALNTPVLNSLPTFFLEHSARAVEFNARGISWITNHTAWGSIGIICYCAFFGFSALQDGRNYLRENHKFTELDKTIVSGTDEAVKAKEDAKKIGEAKLRKIQASGIQNLAKLSATYGIFWLEVSTPYVLALSAIAFGAVRYNQITQKRENALIEQLTKH